MSNKELMLNHVDDDEEDDDKEVDDDTKDIHLPCLLDTVGQESEESSSLCTDSIFLDDSYYNANTGHSLSPDTWSNEPVSNMSLVVADEVNGIRLQQIISPCLLDHEIHTCDYDQAYDMCNKKAYLIIWLYLGNPASQEVLGFTTSIRYASKTNHNTVILGVTPTSLDVDLSLHGLAEVVVEPIKKSFIISKYKDWTTINIEEEKEVSSSQTITTTNTSSTSLSTDILNLNTPSTVPVPWVPNAGTSKNTIVSNTVVTTTEVVPVPVQHIPPIKRSSHSGSNSQRLSRQAMAADHTTKEKLRRERIKDSCDQLRVLLPYIRGRKTDMASILEMTVDYLKLITTSIPADFQNQIILLMGKATPCDEVRNKSDTNRTQTTRKTTRRSMATPPSPTLGKVSSTSELSNDNNPVSINSVMDINGNITTPGRQTSKCSSPISYPNLKRDPAESTDVKPAKRMLMTTSSTPSVSSNMLYLTTDQNERKECLVSDSCHEDPFTGHLQPIHLSQSHLYGDMDRLYSMSGYPQLSNTTNPRLALDRDGYGMFMDTYYHYYTGQQPHNTGYASAGLSDYVNPNAVLPVTYSSRLPDSRSYDDNDRFPVQSSVDDVYISVTSNSNQT